MNSLEGDGVCEHLFEFIWCKDELSFRPTINIPDTIVYKFGQPVSWYFTGLDGKVKKKFKANIINTKIEEALTRANVGSDHIAYYISWISTAVKCKGGESKCEVVSTYIPRGCSLVVGPALIGDRAADFRRRPFSTLDKRAVSFHPCDMVL